MGSPTIVRRALLLAAAVALAAGCSVQANGGPAPSTAGPSPSAAQPAAPETGGAGMPDAAELQGDIETAVTVTNGFWATHWTEFFTGTYTPPRVAGAYGAPYTSPTCGGTPPEPDNAFYCQTGEDFLAWDNMLMAQGAQIGDAWVYLIIAHEWGHAIQYRLAKELQTPDAELQADCLAGATLYGAVKDQTLQFEQGDERELTRALTELADDTPWTQEGDHGDTFERIGAFGQGRTGGVDACLAKN